MHGADNGSNAGRIDPCAQTADYSRTLRDLNAVLDSIEYGVLFMDKDLNVRVTNRAYQRMWELPPSLLERKPLNLIANACKFTQHGSITLTVHTDGVHSVTFEVLDTGIGMNADQLAHLFDEFTQGDPSTTRRYGGTGLGLTITRRLCDLLGGEISVSSRPDEGTRLVVSLPVETSAA